MLQNLKELKYYILLLMIALGGYTWLTLNGIKLLGDDNQSKENRSGYTRSYYHK
ncbi:hypothetical protein [Solitalea canadensis]|uniref:Uncharacterized protein n=1 Tax=Solitalea canadensis (strain ATCC 29591 / DSM 3403 / JCM 21819 / LMG 8368 / NBRC 15130 / NCIMB 12057 / USAM 9D) TaxID=929556 RepID=H8KUL9_SOLCM|nr:hypothetical protein [Solitalea canadensis]AFD07443.1 hypothetical protein Solca_2402 [Solitalea canadensis DSM 3403]